MFEPRLFRAFATLPPETSDDPNELKPPPTAVGALARASVPPSNALLKFETPKFMYFVRLNAMISANTNATPTR